MLVAQLDAAIGYIRKKGTGTKMDRVLGGCRRETASDSEGEASMGGIRVRNRLNAAIQLPDVKRRACAARQVRSGMLDAGPV